MKENINFLVELSESELIEIEGGDPFMKDLGRFIGALGGYAFNLSKDFSSAQQPSGNIGGPTANHS
jgi:hypothetical protein